MEFNLASAMFYARSGRIEEWVHAYLMGGPWANQALSDGLNLQPRWWAGPIELPLESVERCCGPEPDVEFSIDPAGWARYTAQLADRIERPEDVPPLIVSYVDGSLSIRDGNHRHEAMRRKGWRTCWVIIWYNSEEDYLRHRPQLTERTDPCYRRKP